MENKISTECINQIKRQEGLKLFAYKCSGGYITIGYGSNLETDGITESDAEHLLLSDLNRIVDKLRLLNWFNDLNDARKSVVINMVYNLGYVGFMKFKKTIEAIENKNYQKASEEMLDSRWATQVRSRALELANQMYYGEFKVK